MLTSQLKGALTRNAIYRMFISDRIEEKDLLNLIIYRTGCEIEKAKELARIWIKSKRMIRD